MKSQMPLVNPEITDRRMKRNSLKWGRGPVLLDFEIYYQMTNKKVYQSVLLILAQESGNI